MREILRKSDLKNFEKKVTEQKKHDQKQNHKLSQIEIGASLCETNPELVPLQADEKSIQKCYKKFVKECTATSTSKLGTRQYRMCLLVTIKHFLNLIGCSVISKNDFDFTENITKSALDEKLYRAILLYSQFQTEIRASVTFG